jgi:hypothetical protein
MAKKAHRAGRPTVEEVILLHPSKARPHLGPPVKRKEIAELRKQFIRAHGDGMLALASSDYDEFGKAIEREREIINKQKAMIHRNNTVATTHPKRRK